MYSNGASLFVVKCLCQPLMSNSKFSFSSHPLRNQPNQINSSSILIFKVLHADRTLFRAALELHPHQSLQQDKALQRYVQIIISDHEQSNYYCLQNCQWLLCFAKRAVIQYATIIYENLIIALISLGLGFSPVSLYLRQQLLVTNVCMHIGP